VRFDCSARRPARLKPDRRARRTILSDRTVTLAVHHVGRTVTARAISGAASGVLGTESSLGALAPWRADVTERVRTRTAYLGEPHVASRDVLIEVVGKPERQLRAVRASQAAGGE
jgi:hypothetical protein